MPQSGAKSIAIIGLGSWGLCVLERLVDRARRTRCHIAVHVVEPGRPGGGVYSADQPDYLVLNNPCGQLSLHASPDADSTQPYAMGLFEWATWRGYRRVGDEYRITGDGQGEAIAPTDYLPRRLMGEYLGWFYRTLVDSAPDNLDVVWHPCPAVDIESQPDWQESVILADGRSVVVDHVVLTSGHTYNDEAGRPTGVKSHRPYPVDWFRTAVEPGQAVAISGMGLVAYDLLTAFSVGRGGTFVPDGDRLRYEPSGAEPVVHLYSRSGLPYLAKSATGLDPTGSYRPVVCTAEALSSLRRPGLTAQADFRADVLPLLTAEMRIRYYEHAALLAGGEEAAERVRAVLAAAWAAGHFDEAVDGCARCHGHFDAEAYLLPQPDRSFASSADYEEFARRSIEADLREANLPGGSPVKAALEVTRILRDELRSVIEFGGLSLNSYLDFQSNVRGRINRIEAGPPPVRSAQLLALMDAGVARIPFGPAPEVLPAGDGHVLLRSTALDQPESAVVPMLIRGHLDLPSLANSASVLLSKLYRLGRLTQMSYGDVAVGSVAISEDFHPFDSEGRLQTSISVLGVLTEGVRYFTHYLPSPRSRLRAVLDAQACVDAVLS